MARSTWTSAGGRDDAAWRGSAAEAGPSGAALARPESGRGTPRIWAIGGGKGGVGKSVVSSSLAAAMAAAGHRCAVIDADLGGANLHTLLGVARPRYSLSHLLNGDVSRLADLMVQTSVPNLWLVSGNQALLEMANPRHRQREMLLREIRGLDVDDVVLDLGAGSAYTVLDFFLLARRGLVVVTPEPTAIENAEHFIRVAFYRSLREVARRPDVAAAIGRLRENGRPRRLHSAGQLIALVRAIDPAAAKPLEERAQTFAPLLIVNQVVSPAQRSIGPRLAASCRERLGAAVEFAGSLDADPNVAEAVARRQPVLQAFPLCRFSRLVEGLAARLQREAGAPGGGAQVIELSPGAASARSARGAAPARRDAEPELPAPRRLPPLDRAEPGSYLRRCREAQGLSLAEVVERTRIRILEQIENERFELLPPEPYLKGYLLEYARALDLPDIADLAKCYLAKAAAPAAEAAPRPAPPAPAPRRRLLSWRG